MVECYFCKKPIYTITDEFRGDVRCPHCKILNSYYRSNDEIKKDRKVREIIPHGNSIFVLPDAIVDKTSSGILLTDFSKKRPTSGTIIAKGRQVKEFTVGTRVVYGEFSGHKQIISWGGQDKEIYVMVENDILATLK